MSPRRILPCATLLLAGCVDRQANLDELPAAEATCMIMPGFGHWYDGSTRALVNEHGTVGSVCLCLTEDERESKSRNEELNDLALIECQRIAKLEHDFDWTDCEGYHDSGEWLNAIYVAVGENAHYNYEGLSCDDEADAPSCSVPPSTSTRTPWGLLALLTAFASSCVGRGQPGRSPGPEPGEVA